MAFWPAYNICCANISASFYICINFFSHLRKRQTTSLRDKQPITYLTNTRTSIPSFITMTRSIGYTCCYDSCNNYTSKWTITLQASGDKVNSLGIRTMADWKWNKCRVGITSAPDMDPLIREIEKLNNVVFDISNFLATQYAMPVQYTDTRLAGITLTNRRRDPWFSRYQQSPVSCVSITKIGLYIRWLLWERLWLGEIM